LNPKPSAIAVYGSRPAGNSVLSILSESHSHEMKIAMLQFEKSQALRKYNSFPVFIYGEEGSPV
jgi:hypothetical protein